MSFLLFAQAARSENWGRGPIEVSDLFPLAFGRLNFSPTTPQTLDPGKLKVRSALHWANTINGIDDNYLLDAESRELLLSSKYGLTKGLEFGVALPVLWRGSGFLDSLIYDWHKFWGLPQGPRTNTESDNYIIAGNTSDGNTFSFEDRGVKLGDLRFSLKKLITKGSNSLPAFTAEFSTRLPTGNSDYSPGGVDLMAAIHASKKLGTVYLYSGIFNSWYQKKSYNDLEYKSYRYGGDLGLEYPLYPDLSLWFNFTASSNLSSDVVTLPNYQLYADIGCKYAIGAFTEFEILIRENPAPDRGSSDFSFLLALSSQFDTN